MNVELLGESWEPSLPASYTARQEVIVAYASSQAMPLRAGAAAIGMCWAHPSVTCPVSYAASGYDAMTYGGQVADWLHSQGVDRGDIVTAGAVSFSAIWGSVPQADEVDAKADFSEAEPTPQKKAPAKRKRRAKRKPAKG